MKSSLALACAALLSGNAAIAAGHSFREMSSAALQAYSAPAAPAKPASDLAPIPGDPTTSNNNAPTGSNPDAQFYHDALAGGEKEVMLSRQAMDQSASVEVRNLASMLVNDHAAMNQELMAAGKLSEPPQTPASRQAAANLGKMSGALFDRSYLAIMQADHEQAIAMFRDASLNAQSSTARNLATAALPKLNAHLVAVQDLQKKMVGP